MYGTNEVASKRASADGFMLKDIWYTIQGEGPWAGYPAVFVRFAGCNLQCSFCDTDFSGGHHISAVDLAKKIAIFCRENKCPRVVLTGGEPMLQPLGDLLYSFSAVAGANNGIQFQIETAGTVWPDWFDGYVPELVIVCSPKTPKVHPMIEAKVRHWKYIIRTGETAMDDGLPVMPNTGAKIYRGEGNIYVQPCEEQVKEISDLNLQTAVQCSLKHGHRLSIQLHKIAMVD